MRIKVDEFAKVDVFWKTCTELVSHPHSSPDNL